MVIYVPFFWFFSPFFICVNNPLRYLYDTNDANIYIKICTAKFLSKFLRPFTPLNERRFAPLPGAACEPAARGVKTASGALWSTKSGIFATLWSDAAASRSALRSETTTRQAVPEESAANYIPIYYYNLRLPCPPCRPCSPACRACRARRACRAGRAPIRGIFLAVRSKVVSLHANRPRKP